MLNDNFYNDLNKALAVIKKGDNIKITHEIFRVYMKPSFQLSNYTSCNYALFRLLGNDAKVLMYYLSNLELDSDKMKINDIETLNQLDTLKKIYGPALHFYTNYLDNPRKYNGLIYRNENDNKITNYHIERGDGTIFSFECSIDESINLCNSLLDSIEHRFQLGNNTISPAGCKNFIENCRNIANILDKFLNEE